MGVEIIFVYKNKRFIIHTEAQFGVDFVANNEGGGVIVLSGMEPVLGE